ncbi:unnamed protein product [Orchesella dallaii]|uniref:F-box domain-containing protein n=1 Tax=Orchesella dallaii TaxID=48710 RepID=A0ABP1RLJ2_9HEXA
MLLSKQNPSSSSEFPSDADASKKPIANLPPEILTFLLDYVVSNGNRKDLLSCRLVNRQWTKIMDSLLEKNFVSGQLSPFPEIGLVRRRGEESSQTLPYVRSHLTMFQDEANPLPFNGLLIDGRIWHPVTPNTEEIHVSLPHFVATAGCGNLTSLAIKNQNIDFNILISILGSTPFLKMLRLSSVMLSTDVGNLPPALPPLPKLPSLIVLDLQSVISVNERQLRAKNKLFFVWLVISFADQLVKLILDTEYTFPALRQGHSYSILVGGKTFSAGTTSASAFGKLKYLKMTDPGKKFLELSTTPVLQSFHYIGLFREAWCSTILRYLFSFMNNCRDTLEKLWMDAKWSNLLDEAKAKMQNCNSPELLSTAIITLPKLKMVTLKYPGLTDSTVWKKNFLVKCPALEVLKVVDFGIYSDVSQSDDDDEMLNDEADDEENAQFLIERAAERAKCFADRRRLYDRLEARHPGKEMDEVFAQYWMEEYGLWNICAELKNVFVQLEMSADWFVVRKPTGLLP